MCHATWDDFERDVETVHIHATMTGVEHDYP